MSEQAAPAPDQAPTSAPSEPPAPSTSTPSPAEGAAAAPSPPPTTPEPPPGTDDWRQSLGEDIRQAKQLQDVKDVDSLARQFVDLQGYVGTAIRPPSEHASAEEKQAFVDKMRNRGFVPAEGVPLPPEDVSGYAPPADLDASQLNPDVVAQYGDWAMEAGLSPDQYQSLMSNYAKLEQAQMQRQAEQKQAGYNELRRNWGYAYEEKVRAAARFAELVPYVPDDLAQAVAAGNVKPEIMNMFVHMAEAAGKEGSVVELESKRVEQTPMEAQLQLNEIMNNREHDYWRAIPGSPEKQAAIAEVMRLQNRAQGREGARPHVVLGGADDDGNMSPDTLFAGRA